MKINAWKNVQRIFRTRFLILFFLGLFSAMAGGWAFIQSDYYLEVKKNLRLFGELYKYITDRYVEDVPPHELMRAGIDGMLDRLDPYTVYYEGEETSDLDVLMQGQYGGIGITIGIKKSQITVISTMDGSPAQRAGIRPGDKIIAVDGISTGNMRLDEMSLKVKGEPGTKLSLTVQRDQESLPVEFHLKREIILVDNIGFAGYIEPGIGYVKLNRFSKTATSDLMKAIQDLKRDTLKGLLFDLRGNSGGMLDAAVDITNFFVKKGERITYTKGKTSDVTRFYDALYDPLADQVPLAVLVDGGSASASEIVAGAIQDLDRGIIIGQKTFGKGLVQTVYPVQDKSMLKITTAKYYTPSGRCIQKELYPFKRLPRRSASVPSDETDDRDVYESSRGDDLRADSVREAGKEVFRTKNGRPVFASGGITPDIEMKEDSITSYHADLLKQGLLFDFATHFVNTHPVMDTNYIFHDSIMDLFDRFLAGKNYKFRTSIEIEFDKFRDMLAGEKYAAKVAKEIESLDKSIQQMKIVQLSEKRTSVAEAIETELAGRYFGNKHRIRRSFKYDRMIRESVSLLRDSVAYQRILHGGK